MFSGLVAQIGTVDLNEPSNGGRRLRVLPAESMVCAPGDSIAVNGVCLTIAHCDRRLTFEIVPETLARSNLDALKAGDPVNLEASLRLGDRLGGHLVYGHVDATTNITRKDAEGQGLRMWCASPPAIAPMIVEKGYVTLDGVSLTVAQAFKGSFAVALVPETIKRTTLGRKNAGDSLNVEVDPIARYVAGLVVSAAPPSRD